MGSSAFARRYWRNHFCFRENNFCFLFLRLLRCFSSPGSPRTPMDSVYGDGGLLRRVSPFRHLRVLGYLLLSAAFRSLSRLSSALSAKASSLRSFQLILLGLLLYSVTGLPAWFFPACCCFAFWRLLPAPASDVFPISSSSAFRPSQTFLIFQISFDIRFSRYIPD